MTNTSFNAPGIVCSLLRAFHVDPNRLTTLGPGIHYTRTHPEISELDEISASNLLDWMPLGLPDIKIEAAENLPTRYEITFNKKVKFSYEGPGRSFVCLPTRCGVQIRQQAVRIPDILDEMHPLLVSHDSIEQMNKGRRVHVIDDCVQLEPNTFDDEPAHPRSIQLTEILAYNRNWIFFPEIQGKIDEEFPELTLFMDTAGNQPPESQHLDTWMRSAPGSDWSFISMARRDPLSKERDVWIAPVKYLWSLFINLAPEFHTACLKAGGDSMVISRDLSEGHHKITLPGSLHDLCISHGVDPLRLQKLDEDAYCSPSTRKIMGRELVVLGILPLSFPEIRIDIGSDMDGENRIRTRFFDSPPKPIHQTPYHWMDKESGRMTIHMGDRVHLFSRSIPRDRHGPPQRPKTREALHHLLNVATGFPQIHEDHDCLEVEIVSRTNPDTLENEIAALISNAFGGDEYDTRYSYMIPIQKLSPIIIEKSACGRPFRVKNGSCSTVHESHPFSKKSAVPQIDGEVIHHRKPQENCCDPFQIDPSTLKGVLGRILIECDRFACAVTSMTIDEGLEFDQFNDIVNMLNAMRETALIQRDDRIRNRIDGYGAVLMTNRLEHLQKQLDALNEPEENI